MTKYKRLDPVSDEERWVDALRPRKDRTKGRRYNWRKILRLATAKPGVWHLFDRHGRDYVVSRVNLEQIALMRTEYKDWEFRAKITESKPSSQGRRRLGKLWIMATERTPTDE